MKKNTASVLVGSVLDGQKCGTGWFPAYMVTYTPKRTILNYGERIDESFAKCTRFSFPD